MGKTVPTRKPSGLALGSDLADLRATIGAKADQDATESAIETAVRNKVDKTELVNLKQTLEEEIAKKGIPIGTLVMFTAPEVPAGYLKADGSAVERERYPDLYAAIGTTYGEGDGLTTFNLPDLIDRFAQGSNTPGQKIEAGLPNFTGWFHSGFNSTTSISWMADEGLFYNSGIESGGQASSIYWAGRKIYMDPSRVNSIYGNSDTVQPPALTLLPCIRAFHA